MKKILVVLLLAALVLPVVTLTLLPVPVAADPGFTARTETYVDSAAAADLTVAKPTGTVDGDILFCFLMWRAAAPPQTIDGVPAGWTLIAEANTGDIDEYQRREVQRSSSFQGKQLLLRRGRASSHGVSGILR